MEDKVVHDVIVAVCTFHRNAELDHLLGKLLEYSSAWLDCRIGVTIIDDSPEGTAKSVADRFASRFPLGLRYENSASRNISIARNLALEVSIGRAGWVAMTDDDCEPSDQWLPELVRVCMSRKADIATGLMLRRAPDHAPAWLKQQPFLELGEFDAEDGEERTVAYTNNCLISSAFLTSHQKIRFDPRFGRIGGEDMAFFHSLKTAGAKIVFAAKAVVFENEPDERLTLRYQLRRHFWHGNSSILTSLERGKGRGRLVLHAVATVARASTRPFRQIASGADVHVLYTLAQMAEGLGKLAGTVGIKVKHR